MEQKVLQSRIFQTASQTQWWAAKSVDQIACRVRHAGGPKQNQHHVNTSLRFPWSNYGFPKL